MKAVTELRPQDLGNLSDEDFRRVVDADLRRRSPREREKLPAEVSDALRTETYIDRWLTELRRISRSVESQLEGREHDFEKAQALIRLRLLDADPAEARKIQVEMEGLTVSHHDSQAKTTRFRSSVQEALVEAEEIREQIRESRGSMTARERNHYFDRANRLEVAIRDHKSAVMADLNADEDVDQVDLALWSALDS